MDETRQDDALSLWLARRALIYQLDRRIVRAYRLSEQDGTEAYRAAAIPMIKALLPITRDAALLVSVVQAALAGDMEPSRRVTG